MYHNMSDSKFQVLQTPTKSESDGKDYKIIKLKNGLIATIISDRASTLRKTKLDVLKLKENTLLDENPAGVALHVGVGCSSDPVDLPGLSHLLETLVFRGSEKFPEDNDFDSFIKTNGGWSGGHTEHEATNFYFNCFEKYLPEALDKFSQFFIAPLMKKEALTRQREAINSEFQIAVTLDSLRKQQLLMSTAKKDSPVYPYFPWGNFTTLDENISDGKLLEELQKRRKRHYSAHRMSLAVQARLPLDILQNLVVQYFSNIPNNKLPPLDFTGFTHEEFDTPEFKKIYYLKPLNEITEVEINWSLPSTKYEYKSKHLKYISNLIEDEGKGSILSYLKKNTWAISLRVGNCCSTIDCTSMYSFFSIIVKLTEEGLKHIFDVIELIFSYINLLKNIGPQKRIYDELKLAADLNFRFDTEMASSYLTYVLAANLQMYPPEDIICGGKLYYEYNPEKITEGLNFLTSRRANIIITSKKLPRGLIFDKRERWFGAEYTSINIPNNLLSIWETVAPYPELNIPPPNPYLPSNFTILPELHNHPEYPRKLIDTVKCELWYKQDQTFKLPQASYYYLLINPICLESAKNLALTDMYVDLLSFVIGEETYPATLASLSCYFKCYRSGIGFKVFGFNEKLSVLVELIIKYMKNLCDYISEDHFNGIKEALLKRYHNNVFESYSLLCELKSKLFLKNHFSALDTYNELSKLTFDDMNQFIKKFHEKLYVKALVQGNIWPDAACETTNNLIKYLQFTEISKYQYPKIKTLQMPVGEKCLRVESLNRKDSNSITSNYYQVGAFTLKNNVLLDLIIRIIGEPMLNVLRTKEQLGYYVLCKGIRSYGILEYQLAINSQTNKYSTDYVDSRIEAFLKHSQALLEETSVDSFEKIKEDLKKTKECCENNLKQEVERNWSEIISDEYMFDRANKEIETLKNITLNELKIWWNKLNQFNSFRKMSIQVVGHIQDNNSEENIPVDQDGSKEITLEILDKNKNSPQRNNYFIEDINQFVANLGIYPQQLMKKFHN